MKWYTEQRAFEVCAIVSHGEGKGFESGQRHPSHAPEETGTWHLLGLGKGKWPGVTPNTSHSSVPIVPGKYEHGYHYVLDDCKVKTFTLNEKNKWR